MNAPTGIKHLAGEWPALFDALKDFPADGRPDRQHPDLFVSMVVLGLVEGHEAKKRCQSCGAETFDYRYFTITPAGHLFMAAVEGARQGAV